MKFGRISFAVVLLAALALSACKSSNQAAVNPPAQPAAANGQTTNPAQPGAPTPAGTQQTPAPTANAQPMAMANNAPAPAPAPPKPIAVDLPSGTPIRVRLDRDLGSKISQPGDTFTATLADDVLVNNKVLIARGARADGTVIDAKPLGRFKGGALLSIQLDRVHTEWGSYPVATGAIDQVEKGKGKRTAGFVGGGAGLGALIGGLAGGKKGALIGGLAGAGAGTAGSAFTGNQQIVLPAETLLTFRLEHSVHIVEKR